MMMRGRASQEELVRLWHAVVQTLLDRMENPPPEGLKASFLAVVIHFLRDNDVMQPNKGDASDVSRNALIEKLKALQAEKPQ